MTDNAKFPEHDQPLLIDGPVGKLQLLLAAPKENALNKVAVICHPNPFFGGTMDNKVVTTLHRAFQSLGMRTVRFNYRGVGKSEGSIDPGLADHRGGVDQGVGETNDALAVLDWVSETCPNYEIYLAGFSFGAYVSYRIAADSAYRNRLAYLLSITMPQYLGLTNLAEPACPWLLVQGELDEVVDVQQVFAWVNTLTTPPNVLKMPEASHFFHGKLVELRESVIQELL